MMIEDQETYLTVPQVLVFGKVGSILVMLLTVFGTIGNSLLLYVTAKSSNLRGACNRLIALQAITDIITVLGHPIFLYLSWTEQLVSFTTCFWLQFIPCSGMNWSTLLILFVGFDRLICVRYPVWYATTNKTGSFLAVCGMCCLYDVALKVAAVFTIEDQLTVCVIAEAYSGLGRFAFVGSQVFINVAVVVVYTVLRKEMRQAKMLNQIRIKETAKVYKALNTVMLCYVLGWLTTMVSLGITMVFTTDVFVTVAVESVVGVFANVNLACPIVVYYTRSSLYYAEIRSVFGIKRMKIAVVTSSLLGSNNQSNANRTGRSHEQSEQNRIYALGADTSPNSD